MAIFNPDVPQTNTPSFLGSTRAISPVEPNKAFQALFSGIGDIIKDTTTGIDLLQKSDIQRQLQPSLDTLRDQRTQYLTDRLGLVKGIAARVGVGGTPEPEAGAVDPETDTTTEFSGQAKKVLPDQPEDTRPQPLNILPERVGNLAAAQASGDISPTYYQQQLVALAKSLRAQYPGQREYIDATISKAVGGDPANQLMRTLYRETATTERALAKNNPQAKFETRGDRLADAGKIDPVKWNSIKQAVRGGMPQQEAEAMVSEMLGNQYRYTQSVQNTAVLGNDKKTKELTISPATNTQISNNYKNTMDTITLTLTNGNTVPISQVITGRDKNGNPLSPEDTQRVLAGLTQLQQNFVAAVERDARAGEPGSTAIDILGQDEIKKRYQPYLDNIQNIRKAITDKDYGTAFESPRVFQMQKDEVKRKLFDPRVSDMAFYNQLIAATNDMFGNNANGQIMQRLLTDPDSPWAMPNKIDLRMYGSQPGYTPGDSNSAPPTTFKDSVERHEKSQNADTPEFAKMVGKQVEIAQTIGNKSADENTRYNFATAVFHPNNYGYIAKFEQDGIKVDPKTGAVTRTNGAWSLFSTIASQPTLQATKDLSYKRDGGELWMYASNWVENTMSRELFPREIQNLNIPSEKYKIVYIPSSENTPPRWAAVPKIDPTSPQASPSERAAARIGGGVNTEFRRIQGSLDRLNIGMQAMYNLYQVDKDQLAQIPGYETVDKYMINKLLGAGLRNVNNLEGTVFEEMKKQSSEALVRKFIEENPQTKSLPANAKIQQAKEAMPILPLNYGDQE